MNNGDNSLSSGNSRSRLSNARPTLRNANDLGGESYGNSRPEPTCVRNNLLDEQPMVDNRGDGVDCDEPQCESRGDCCEESLPEAPTPTPQDMREVKIVKLNYGFIVTVGCHKFAIEKPETVAEKLGEYLKDPFATEQKWFAGKLF